MLPLALDANEPLPVARPRYRQQLPHLERDALFLTDAGLETMLVFQDGIDLPHFAAFDLLRTDAGRTRLRRYYEGFATLAVQQRVGLVLEAPTWRASPDWGARLGYDLAALAAVNRDAIALLTTLRDAHACARSPMVVSGNLGPRGDGYVVGQQMSVAEAREYHAWQVGVFALTAADMISVFTMNYAEEAAGIALAARAAELPLAVSFTLETDGRLPSGQPLAEAIAQVDAASSDWPAYYMINCAHPDHFAQLFATAAPWQQRVRGVRANASRRSHAELEASTTLDAGDPEELGGQYRQLRSALPQLSVVGGCCGTDHRHVAAIGRALAAAQAAPRGGLAG
jgi:S-methylmethionine-dependent homocysteine/selenocysteine methylase